MKLLYSPASPFVRNVRVTIREIGLTDQVEECEVTASPIDPIASDLEAANPSGKIPVLIRATGKPVFDSRVINRFLNDRATADLYPQDNIWEILTLEALGNAISDASVAMTYEMRFRSAELQSQDWLDGQWRKVSRSLKALESDWMDTLNGQLTIGHIGVGCALGYLDLRHDVREWRAIAPTLAAWEAEFAKRDSMVATAPPT